jgi:hypothetical protein
MDELITYPASVHDDLCDALAYCLTIASTPGIGSTAHQYTPSNLRYSNSYKAFLN